MQDCLQVHCATKSHATMEYVTSLLKGTQSPLWKLAFPSLSRFYPAWRSQIRLMHSAALDQSDFNNWCVISSVSFPRPMGEGMGGLVVGGECHQQPSIGPSIHVAKKFPASIMIADDGRGLMETHHLQHHVFHSLIFIKEQELREKTLFPEVSSKRAVRSDAPYHHDQKGWYMLLLSIFQWGIQI